MRAAKWLGVPPWELAKQSILWYQWALICESIDREEQAAMLGAMYR